MFSGSAHMGNFSIAECNTRFLTQIGIFVLLEYTSIVNPWHILCFVTCIFQYIQMHTNMLTPFPGNSICTLRCYIWDGFFLLIWVAFCFLHCGSQLSGWGLPEVGCLLFVLIPWVASVRNDICTQDTITFSTCLRVMHLYWICSVINQ